MEKWMHNKKILSGVVIALVILCATTALIYRREGGFDQVLEVGIFAGSNWGVANANSYVI